MNWYKKATRGTDRDLSTEYTQNGSKPDEELTQTKVKPVPLFGGNERSTSDGIGYPKGISQNEDADLNKGIGQDQIPAGSTILDDDIYKDDGNGVGANDDRFSDPIDVPFQKHNDPVGAFNMQEKNLFEYVRKKTRKNRVNKL